VNYKYKQSHFKKYPCHCEEQSQSASMQAWKQSLPSVIARSETTKQSQEVRLFSIPRRTACLLFFVLVSFLLTSFLVNASTQDISITNIWYKKMPNYTHLTIKATGPFLEYEAFNLEEENNPKKIVIDIKNAVFKIEGFPKNTLILNMGSVRRVRFGQFKSEPIPITSFVIDLFQKTNYEVKLSSDKRLLYIDVYDFTEFKEPEEQIFTVTPVKSEAVKIEKEEEPKISLVDTVTTPITLNLKEAEVVDAVRALSEISGINMVVDDSVTGKITLNLREVSFKDSLDLILKLKGLDYTEVSNVLIIAQKELIEGYKKPITRIFELKNASAEAAKVILDGYKTEGSKVNIVADARMNTLIITGTNEEIEKVEGIIGTIDEELLTRTFKIDNAIDEEDLKAIQSMLSIIIPDAENRVIIDNRQSEIIVKGTKEELKKTEDLIPKLDKRATQMEIEIKFVEISLNEKKDLGIRWTGGAKDADGNLIEGQITIGEITLGGSFERSGLIKVTIDALVQNGKANILSNPKVHAFNGKKAFILSGARVPYEEETPEGGIKINWQDVGVNMTITPWISSDGLITMFIRAEKSYIGPVKVRDLPEIVTQQIGYKEGAGPAIIIRARPDDTSIIGGLIELKDEENIVKIPLLGDIPIIGELFRRTNKINEKTEIIILITAHLLDY